MFKSSRSYLAGIIAAVAVCELVLSALPVKQEVDRLPVHNPDDIVLAVPGTHYLYSRGWSMANVRQGDINEAGFPALRPYPKSQPSIALIGDSYIEGLMVEPRSRVQERLTESSGIPVFGFGRSGADLGEYAAMVRYVSQRWKPEALILSVAELDIRGAFTGRRGDHYYTASASECRLNATERNFTSLISMAKHSHLFKYVLYNLELGKWYQTTFSKGAAGASGPSLEIKRKVIDCFLDDVVSMSGLPTERIMLVVDDGRFQNLYAPASAQNYTIASGLQYLSAQARQRGMSVAETYPLFRERYVREGLRQDFAPYDWHWNEAGHETIATAVCRENAKRPVHPALCVNPAKPTP